MSDRLPVSRRRSAGGKHVALPVRPLPAEDHRPTHHAAGRVRARLAKGGIVTALTLAFGAVVVAPVWGDSSTGSSSGAAAGTVADAGAAQAAVPAGPSVAQTVAQESASTVFVADAAVDAARQVRDAASAAAVDPAQVAALDAAANELDELLGSATAEQLADRSGATASRSQERTSLADETPAAESADGAATAESGTDAAAPADAPTDPAASPSAGTVAPTDPAATPTAAPGTLLPGAASLTTGVDQLRAAVAAVAALTQQVEKTTADAVAAQAAAAEAARVAAEQEAQRAAWKASLLGYANGRIPASALCSPAFDPSVELRCDAAEALDALDTAYLATFGTHLDVSDSYRSYAGQVACRRTKGSLCATPGTSNHGTGVAVDLGGGVEGFGTAQFVWMTKNAGTYGWVHPDWAEAGGSKPEAWHWEYAG